MKNELSVWMMLSVAVLLGSVSATAIGGCEGNLDEAPADVSDTPPVEPNGMAPADPGVSAEDPISEPASSPEAASGDAPAEEGGQPAAEEPAAEEPAAEEPAAEEPAAEEPAAEEPAAEEPAAEEPAAEEPAVDQQASEGLPIGEATTLVAAPDVKEYAEPEQVLGAGGDWPQWGGTRLRNNSPAVSDMPASWDVGRFDRRTGEWDQSNVENIKWVASLGSQTYGNPVVSGGRVFVGTNNGAGHLPRYPNDVDLGCLLCFDETTGELLWQHSSEKLITGRVHDWPLQGICCAPLVEGDRLWFVTSRGEVRCLDAAGFRDGQDDGPVVNETGRVLDINNSDEGYQAAVEGLDSGQLVPEVVEQLKIYGFKVEGEPKVTTGTAGKKWTIVATSEGTERTLNAIVAGPRLSFFKVLSPADSLEADTIWVFNMMEELGVSQHNMASCSVTSFGDLLFVNTSNGLDESHINLPAPEAPSFVCMDKNTGEVLWTNGAPGTNILHGQWSSPTVAVLGGVPQVLFAGGDGWLYSFRADRGVDGDPELLWKFDCNPKESEWILGGVGTRNNLIATPSVYDGLVYIAVGQDPEHGEGEGHLWCIDPTKRGDISQQLAVKLVDGERVPLEHKRIQAVVPEEGEAAIDNPNSGVVWHYTMMDQNEDDIIDFEEEMHRSCGTCTIKDNVLYLADFSGLVHCLDAKGDKEGKPIVHFTYDMLAQSWGSALIADDKVYIGDEDGDVCIFEFGAENSEPVEEINMGSSVYSTPIAANNTLFISTKDKLFAIAKDASSDE